MNAPSMQLATLCYVRHLGKTLMLHRNAKKDDIHVGKWNGLGGKFNPGETPEECVIREVHEESGLVITNPQWRGFLTFPKFNRGVDWYVHVYVATEFTGALIASPEGDLCWVDNDKVGDLNLWPGDYLFLPWLAQNRHFSAKFTYQDGVLLDHHVVFYSCRQDQ